MLEMTSSLVTEVAPSVHHISLLGSSWINAYLIGDILIDAGIRASAPKLARVLSRRPIRAHALTHVHDDHQGSSRFVCSQFGVPLWVHTTEADLMTNNRMRENVPRNLVTAAQRRFWGGDPYPVSRGLQAGDDLNGFEVLETPGHSRGHISLWRESDRVLIVGDVLTNMNIATTRGGLHEPLSIFTLDKVRNREQIHRLAKLEPALSLFGHGRPLRDPEAIARFAATLPSA
jgi:hydroxyacylglutathione hydrolase